MCFQYFINKAFSYSYEHHYYYRRLWQLFIILEKEFEILQNLQLITIRLNFICHLNKKQSTNLLFMILQKCNVINICNKLSITHVFSGLGIYFI
jgi:hypothetical protein